MRENVHSARVARYIPRIILFFILFYKQWFSGIVKKKKSRAHSRFYPRHCTYIPTAVHALKETVFTKRIFFYRAMTLFSIQKSFLSNKLITLCYYTTTKKICKLLLLYRVGTCKFVIILGKKNSMIYYYHIIRALLFIKLSLFMYKLFRIIISIDFIRTRAGKIVLIFNEIFFNEPSSLLYIDCVHFCPTDCLYPTKKLS